ncbi:MAG: nucleoside transporter C-terminal domain-containing protein [bacterium]|nr:nucleoside transporter C-terminal domain-containing protein [bacterium]
MPNLISLLGIFVLMGLGLAVSNNRRRVRWRTVIWGVGLQFGFALILLRTPWGTAIFDAARVTINRVLGFTDAGASFLFGNLFRGNADVVQYLEPGAEGGFIQFTNSATGELAPLGMIFAIHVLPTVIFFASLMAVLYHLGVMQRVIAGISWVMRRTMRTSGSETLSVAADIFVGQTEAPVVIRPYIKTMTNSELMAVMTAGFATIAGGVMAAYVRLGIDAGHLLAASIMSAPAALVMAKIMFPETEQSDTEGGIKVDIPREYSGLIDAAAGGASVGLKLAANIGAMLLAFVALVAMVDAGLGLAGLSLSQIFGWVFAPLAWTLGVPWSEASTFGNLLGTKISVNEFLGYIQLDQAIRDGTLSPRSVVIATYALCGFANFSSIAIQIGGYGILAPERRSDVARLGLRAMFAGTFANLMTAAIAGILTT